MIMAKTVLVMKLTPCARMMRPCLIRRLIGVVAVLPSTNALLLKRQVRRRGQRRYGIQKAISRIVRPAGKWLLPLLLALSSPFAAATAATVSAVRRLALLLPPVLLSLSLLPPLLLLLPLLLQLGTEATVHAFSC